MKPVVKLRNKVLVACGAALLAAAHLSGQATPQKLIVEVPFGFRAGSATFQAGQYTLTLGTVPGIIALQAADGHVVAMIVNAVETRTAPQNAQLVFHRYGHDYFLSQVWTWEANRGRQIPQGASEREIASTGTPASREVLLARAAGR